jgi:sterol desaturase/sphingolipid hydroxylase (fatty acid hydroxylase superfamily)
MTIVLVLMISVVMASFIGYWVHRAIHQKWAGPFYRAHMEHHLELYPPGKLTSTKYRAARWYNRGPFLFTPALLAAVCCVGAVIHALHAPPWMIVENMGTFIMFGVLNDWIHDTTHLRRHFLQKFTYYRRIRAAHLIHHVNMNKNYGIVSFEWDRAFKTATLERAR